MEDITAIELKSRMDNGTAPMIIDVRETWEFDEFNIGATLIPLAELPGKWEDLEDHKQEEIVVHCRSGARSATAKAFLESQGFSRVRNLLGGMLDWQRQFGA
ncbi:MAG: rhodanese-like domain-containing protein [Sphingomonadales bacterium]|nr:rhodanese-like domain-containing protein [Sphingomonadales bacterium]